MQKIAHLSPFQEAVVYYHLYRAPYAPAAFEYIRSEFDLRSGKRIFDLGCGPGTMALPLAATGAKIVAVDRDPDMIGEAKRLASSQRIENITWLVDSAERVVTRFSGFDLVTFGLSLHWMDRDFILDRLKNVICDGGGIAVFDVGKRRPQETWEALALEIAFKYLGSKARHALKHPEIEHEPCLRRSSHFSNFRVREFASEVSRDPASSVGCVYSWANTPKSMFGDRVNDFEEDLTGALLKIHPTGTWTEKIESVVYLAHKQSGG